MSSKAPDEHNRKIIVGVDTHKYVHVAVAIDNVGTRLGCERSLRTAIRAH